MVMAIGKNRMTVSQAAKAIGVTAGRLRQMIGSGECTAVAVETPFSRTGYYWEIPKTEVTRIKGLENNVRPGRRRNGVSRR